MDRERLRAALYVAVSASAFGAMAIFARFAAADGASILVVLFLRFALAGALMAGVMAIAGQRWPRGRALAVLSAMGGLGYVGQSLCFFSALGYASAGMVALLLYLHPFIVTVLAALLLGHRLGRLRIACVLAASAGTALTIGGDLRSQPLGLLLGAGAALIYSGYILVGARVLESQPPLAAATVVMVSAATVLGVLVALIRPAWPASAAGWLWIGLIALISTVFAMVLLFAGMRRLGPADAVTLSTLEPVVTFVLAAIVLDERVSPLQAVGGTIVICAVVWLARYGGAGAPQPSMRSSSRSKR